MKKISNINRDDISFRRKRQEKSQLISAFQRFFVRHIFLFLQSQAHDKCLPISTCPFVIEFSLIKTLFIAAQKKAPYFINSPHNSFAPFTYINCHKMIEFESRCTPANPILKIGKVQQSTTNLIYLRKSLTQEFQISTFLWNINLLPQFQPFISFL